jgi:hypothetical protein
LTIFDDIEAEAGAASDAYYHRAMSEPTNGDGPGADEIADEAHEHGLAAYCDLVFVSRQVLGLAVAGLYHLWERLTKEFLLRELSSENRLDRNSLRKCIGKANFNQIICCLCEMGWSVRGEAFYGALDRLRLIAAVIKHGDGVSCSTLLSQATELFHDFGHDWMNTDRRADSLELNRVHFEVCDAAVRAFFEAFPERLNRPESPDLVRSAIRHNQKKIGE